MKKILSFIILSLDEPLTLAYIKNIHRELGKYTVINAGSLRLDPAGVGGTTWQPEIPDAMKMETNIQEVLDIVSPLDRALHMVAYLCKTKAFYDGNKRIAMLIGNKIMIENGLGIISVPQDKIAEFYKELITYYEEDDVQRFKQFLYDFCLDGTDFSLE